MGWRRRWRRLPIAVRIVLGLVAVLFAIWLILFITKGRFLKRPFQSIVGRSLEREVRVGGDFQLYFAPVTIKFLAEDFRIANPRWAGSAPLFKADLIDARIATFRLLFGTRRINSLVLNNGRAELLWSKDHARNSWTFGDPDKKGERFEFPDVRQAIVSGTRVHYDDPRLQLDTTVAVENIRASDTRFTDNIQFRGTGTLRQEPFTMTGSLLSPNETASGGRNRLALAIRSADATMDVSGTLPAATQLEGADLALRVRGGNLARLFDFIGVAIPDTRRYRIRSALTYVDDQWRFTRLRGVFGASDLAGRLTVDTSGERLHLDAALATQSLDMVDAGPFVGYDPAALEAKGASGAIKSTGGTPRLLPDAPLRVDAISRFDADLRWTVKRITPASVPISNVVLTLDLDRSRLALSPLNFTMGGGALASDIVIDARRRPVRTQYDIRLAPTPMSTLLGGWGVEKSGTSGTIKARIRMSGDGDTVHDSLASSNGRIAVIIPRGTMWARNIQVSELDIGTFVQKMFEDKLKDPVQINCGLVAFTVRNGIAAADPILIDTRKNVITGRGGFSFRTEAVDLALRADGKKFSLFSGQSPIGLGGHFAAPAIRPISPELLSRAGAGVGLAMVATPLASVLAFVDVGDAKSAACGPILSGATAGAQRTKRGNPRDDVSSRADGKTRSETPDKKKFLGIF